jgi:hypothetical protein
MFAAFVVWWKWCGRMTRPDALYLHYERRASRQELAGLFRMDGAGNREYGSGEFFNLDRRKASTCQDLAHLFRTSSLHTPAAKRLS